MAGSQDFIADPRNGQLKVWLNGRLMPKDEAKVSIFDAGFALGDGVWEGLRVHKGVVLFREAHLDRLEAGAKELELDLGLDRAGLCAAIAATLEANGMVDGGHIRLMATRGVKAAVNQDPRNALGSATIAIVAEYKTPNPELASKGLHLATSTIRCTPAEMFDMRLNTHSRLNLIRALIEAIRLGGDEALMLDPGGFVSSCNATNFFFVANGEVCTSTGEYCFNGVTRGNVIRLCDANAIPLKLGFFHLAAAHAADEAFVTGTFGGLTPVRAIDGRVMAGGAPGPVTKRLIELYEALKDEEALSCSLRAAP